MIDPKHITQYGLDRRRLEEHLIFWIAVAGKTAKTISPRIDAVLRDGYRRLGHRGPICPFKIIKGLGARRLRTILKKHGIGCHGLKSKAMVATANCTSESKTSGGLLNFQGMDCFF